MSFNFPDNNGNGNPPRSNNNNPNRSPYEDDTNSDKKKIYVTSQQKTSDQQQYTLQYVSSVPAPQYPTYPSIRLANPQDSAQDNISSIQDPNFWRSIGPNIDITQLMFQNSYPTNQGVIQPRLNIAPNNYIDEQNYMNFNPNVVLTYPAFPLNGVAGFDEYMNFNQFNGNIYETSYVNAPTPNGWVHGPMPPTIQQIDTRNNVPKMRVNGYAPFQSQEGHFLKPVFSYSCLIALALKNSDMGSLPVNEIYKYMMENFPYFRNAPDGWKNSVRHNLSLNKAFQKTIRNDNSTTQRKGCLWTLKPEKRRGIEREIRKWFIKHPDAIRQSMQFPEKFESYFNFDLDDSGDDNSRIENTHEIANNISYVAPMATNGIRMPPIESAQPFRNNGRSDAMCFKSVPRRGAPNTSECLTDVPDASEGNRLTQAILANKHNHARRVNGTSQNSPPNANGKRSDKDADEKRNYQRKQG